MNIICSHNSRKKDFELNAERYLTIIVYIVFVKQIERICLNFRQLRMKRT